MPSVRSDTYGGAKEPQIEAKENNRLGKSVDSI